MPKAAVARPKRMRSPKPEALEQSLTWLVLDLEEPMREAANYVQALSLIGRSLIASHDNGGEAIITVASAASDRLDALKAKWRRSAPRTGGACARRGGGRKARKQFLCVVAIHVLLVENEEKR